VVRRANVFRGSVTPPMTPEAIFADAVSPSVWVIDDSPLQGEVVRHALAPQFSVEVFDGGAIAVERLAAGETPDVLLLDWHMPEMSGRDVCGFVRQTFNSSQLPIVVLTATGTQTDLLEALAAGANDFVQKPVSTPELVARVSGLVRMAHLSARLSETDRKLRLEAVFRERFMGMLAHDLRQPLSTVLLGFSLLAEIGVPPQAAKVHVRQLRAAERMQRMVTDLLDSTRHSPESGMPIVKRWLDFADVARTSLDEIRSAHPACELALDVAGSCDGHWDPDRLAQVLSNLVGNAIAHGEPRCRVAVWLNGEDNAHLELRVTNRGQPIPEDVLATLAHPFTRARSARRSSEGLGLGLHIVSYIVRAHGGTLFAESGDGETAMVVRLPRQPEDFTPPPPTAR
jgi:two-component system, sensor histidine kinase and response regulator